MRIRTLGIVYFRAPVRPDFCDQSDIQLELIAFPSSSGYCAPAFPAHLVNKPRAQCGPSCNVGPKQNDPDMYFELHIQLHHEQVDK